MPNPKTTDPEAGIAAFLKVRPYIGIAHHIPGRIRLKVSWGALAAVPGFDTAQMETMIGAMHGIRNVRLNRAAGSATVEYDHSLIAPALWQQLTGSSDEEAAQIIRSQIARNTPDAPAQNQPQQGASS